MLKSWKSAQNYLLVAPQFLVLFLFLVLPILAIIVISFWDFNGLTMTPDFTLENYQQLFSPTYLRTYLNNFKFTAIVWVITLLIGFPVAYFLAFHIKTLRWQIILFLICTVPFWTSNIIRMISWVPFLGREGLLNQALLALNIIERPVDLFLFSEFSVILALVHLYTLFMIAPIFNSMMRIDRSLISAAKDSGASSFQVLKEIIIPLSAPGIAIGSIFIVTLVMGEFVTVRMMGGGQISSVGYLMSNQIRSLQYPLAAANAVVLLFITLILVTGILRVVDIRKEL
ncbi:ABC transporter permease [Desertifilum sp. FACHB-1129]|uniref:ABC transporter permease n=2 Tax=Desertifilum tharense IPPAS B-1220 TaxID=1781255 RepID=A0A1E5QGG9_9CYAN|nr:MULTISPECIES: ABC transporter permease [Desertifilum]MDA0209296.1 ABC transporter permease [Cyanobacteria bacterium FC1]MBD2315077.1 ABC transporter permease [Desertifilum sp. FACHB-1129]MBD2325158.1 ABC transporter permease [Desertifilum sp. FACHB-866]MBD2332700.1 ABC transporter permease [Desertifilum sp. FACHB-868]OEJ73687.1 ABC transporter permease [Desertifilum tharense IPPAS B-1220]